jgi:hypothetical protein
VKFNVGKLAGSVDGYEEMELAFCGSDFGNVDVEVANRTSLELLLLSLAAFNLWQSFNAMALKATMQRRSRQVLNCRLQTIKAIVKGQQRIAPECNHHSFLLWREDSRVCLFRSSLAISQRLTVLPLRHCLRIDAVAFSQRPYALLTMLYCSTDCLICRGADVKNLAYSAYFHSMVKIVPSNVGTEHLVGGELAPKVEVTGSNPVGCTNFFR